MKKLSIILSVFLIAASLLLMTGLRSETLALAVPVLFALNVVVLIGASIR